MIFKKTLKIAGYLLLVFFAFVVLYLLSAFILSRLSVKKERGVANDVAIYILTNGYHTDLVLPVKNRLKNWGREIKFENTISRDTNAKYIAFGWGDKGFYLSATPWWQVKLNIAFKAEFAIGTSVMHTTFYKKLQESADCKKIMISNNQYSRLVNYIDNRFKRDVNSNVINIKTNANYDNYDAFYEANGKYNLFYNCNSWANNALKSCGQKACVWTPFNTGIFYQYRSE